METDRDTGCVYWDSAMREIPRVLGMMDREEFSPTCGCLDRTFWAWKFVDFPGARYQEGLCALAYVYRTKTDRSPYFDAPRLLRWITGGFEYWIKIQRRGGDFDEAYPFERSLAATAFSSFYLAEAWHLVGDQLPPETKNRFRRALARAGAWLERNDESHGFLSNHLAAAAAALYHAYSVCEEERFEARSAYFVQRILDHQSKEGWYEEYGGADPGYQTHGSFYLARLWELSGDGRLRESLDRSLSFLAHFIHPDRSLGGGYASRNTQTYYPAAFESCSTFNGTARWIAETMLESITTGSAVGLGSVDRQNLFPLLNNYLFAHRACTQRRAPLPDPVVPVQGSSFLSFPEAGIAKVRKERYELFIGLRNGGVIKAFDRRKACLVYEDSGYIGTLESGKLLSSQWSQDGWDVTVLEDELVIEGDFCRFSQRRMNPLLFIGFRLFGLTLGRLRSVGLWLKSALVRALIYRGKRIAVRFKRRIRFEEWGFSIHDEIRPAASIRIKSLKWVDTFSTFHMGSSRYFATNQLCGSLEPSASEVIHLTPLQREIHRSRRIQVS